jgi:hypothetical protein
MTDAEAIALAENSVSPMFRGTGKVTRKSADEQNEAAKKLSAELGIDIPTVQHEQIRINFSVETPIGKKIAHVVIENGKVVSGMASG